MKDATLLALMAILCVTLLEAVWIAAGNNHNSLVLTVGAIGTFAGFGLGRRSGRAP